MVGVEGIADWVGREVVDREGEKVGKLAEVYYDTTDSEPAFVSVKSGTFGRSHSLAPLKGATLARDYVRLDASKELIRGAPSEDAGGRLSGVDAIAVLGHYGLPSEPDLEGEDRVCFQTVAAAEETERKRAEVEAEQAREAGGASAAADAGGTLHAGEADAAPQPDRDMMEDDRHTAPDRARNTVENDPPPVPAPAPTAAPSTPSADDDPSARLEQLERRVAALEARLG